MPGPIALMIFTLACETGWSEAFLGEWLPLPRFWTYWHCAQARNPNVWTVDPRQAIEVAEPTVPTTYTRDEEALDF